VSSLTTLISYSASAVESPLTWGLRRQQSAAKQPSSPRAFVCARCASVSAGIRDVRQAAVQELAKGRKMTQTPLRILVRRGNGGIRNDQGANRSLSARLSTPRSKQFRRNRSEARRASHPICRTELKSALTQLCAALWIPECRLAHYPSPRLAGHNIAPKLRQNRFTYNRH
jgi:hypothetical protein